MPSKPQQPRPSDGFHRPHVSAALLVSALSVVWTVVASSLAVTIGVRSHTAVLVAFGAIGAVDAIGSVALVYHFQHGLRHGRLSDELEKLAHRVVLVGLFSVGCASVLGGLVRLALSQTSEPSDPGVALAAISVVALIALSLRKRQVARRIASKALLSDGHLSAVGAMQGAVTLAGTAMAGWLGWHWADAAATTIVGSVAILVAASTWRTEDAPNASSGTPTPGGTR